MGVPHKFNVSRAINPRIHLTEELDSLLREAFIMSNQKPSCKNVEAMYRFLIDEQHMDLSQTCIRL